MHVTHLILKRKKNVDVGSIVNRNIIQGIRAVFRGHDVIKELIYITHGDWQVLMFLKQHLHKSN